MALSYGVGLPLFVFFFFDNNVKLDREDLDSLNFYMSSIYLVWHSFLISLI